MKNYKKKESKDDIMQVRVSTTEKQKFTSDAKELDMNLSQYIIHLLRRKQINQIEGGVELAREIYKLNQNLNQFAACPEIPTQEVLNTVTQCLEAIVAQTKQEG